MTGIVVRAGGEGLIWLVVGIFWVIAQIAGAAARKKVQPPTLPPKKGEEEEEPLDPIAELMQKLTGVRGFKIPHPEEREEPEFIEAAPREVKAEQRWKSGDIEKLPEIKPLRRAAAEKPVMPKVAEVDVRPKMSAFRNALPSMKLPVMNLRINTPSYAEASAGKQGLGSELHLQDKKALRRAMLSHIIFSPPKALQR